MQFIYFESIRVGINLNRIEWYSVDDDMSKMTFKMVSGKQFFIQDQEEISYFFDVVMLMELESEEE